MQETARLLVLYRINVVLSDLNFKRSILYIPVNFSHK